MTSIRSASAPAANSRRSAARAPAISKANSAWASAIWRNTASTRAWATISPTTRRWRSSSGRSATVSYTRSPTSTAKKRSSRSATARRASATPSVLHSFTTPRTCPRPRTARTSRPKSAWPAASASRYARSARRVSARSYAGKTVPSSNIRRPSCRTTFRGVRKSGITSTATRSARTATRPVPRPARPPARRTLRSRAMSRWQRTAATKKP